jgi:hypothetical protein
VRLQRRFLSGADCGWTQIDKSEGFYCRRNGRAFRTFRNKDKHWQLYRIENPEGSGLTETLDFIASEERPFGTRRPNGQVRKSRYSGLLRCAKLTEGGDRTGWLRKQSDSNPSPNANFRITGKNTGKVKKLGLSRRRNEQQTQHPCEF